VDRSRISGLGVYATVPLPAKCMALEYVGEVITNAEADLREELERAEIVKAAEREGRVATACELARAATYMFTLDPAVGDYRGRHADGEHHAVRQPLLRAQLRYALREGWRES
jgi:hypothetical protein